MFSKYMQGGVNQTSLFDMAAAQNLTQEEKEAVETDGITIEDINENEQEREDTENRTDTSKGERI